MTHQKFICVIWTLFLVYGCSDPSPPKPQSQQGAQVAEAIVKPEPVDRRPNILLIVADDLGYTDLGIFGSEIATPNLDQLANRGVLLTNFHTAANCSPTRSMLLSGTDNHLAGLGGMAETMAPNQQGKPGFEGYLNFQVAALPELLLDAGYHTYMTGKWHLGLDEETSPAARGFEKSFALMNGGGGHFTDLDLDTGLNHTKYREGRNEAQLPEDFYSSKFYAETMIQYIDSNLDDDKPFFSYLAFTAPHWPLQAPEESIEKYKGKYDEGYEALFASRLQALKDRGIREQSDSGPPLSKGQASWDELTEEQKRIEVRTMEIYAAMIDDLDVYVGKIIDYLEEKGELDNTFIFFMSDNGAEGHDFTNYRFGEWSRTCCDNSYENMGKANSYIWQGPNWARASVGTGRIYKGFVTQGGIQAPAFVSYPKLQANKQVNDSFVSVKDVMPTLLELSGAAHPVNSYKGREVLPMEGNSMMAMLEGRSKQVHEEDYVMGWELFGKQAIRKGDWKIVNLPPPFDDASWKLFNLADDPSELINLAEQQPEKLKEMLILWRQYAQETGVIFPDKRSGY